MIQRIQSLFLVISVAISASTFILPFGEKMDSEGQMQMLSLLGNATQEPNYGLLLVNLLVLLVAVVAIFNFKRRALQMKLCRLGSLLSIALLVLAFYASESLVGEGKVVFLAGIYVNAIQPVLFFVARRYIHKDDLLVKSADRIR
ncbi:MAG: DUF4293 domain-containing protein [Bacteroidota bacterium]